MISYDVGNDKMTSYTLYTYRNGVRVFTDPSVYLWIAFIEMLNIVCSKNFDGVFKRSISL